MRIEPLEPTRCEEYLELAEFAAVDGVSGAERALLEDHLEVCADCAMAVEQMDELDGQVRASLRRTALVVVAPDALKERVRAALEAAPTALARAQRMRRWLSAAAAVLVLVVGGWAYAEHRARYRWSPVQDMIHKHAVYQGQGEPGWAVSTPDRAELARWGSAQLGYRVELPSRTDDWMVRGVRTEPITGTETLMAFFTDRTGMPTSVFAISAETMAQEEIVRHVEMDAGGKSWSARLKLEQVHGDRLFHVELWREGALWFVVVRHSPELATAR